MRLLILSSEFPPGPGGIGTHAYNVARQLHESGWEVRVITRQDHVTDEEVTRFNKGHPFTITQLRAALNLPTELANRLRAITSTVRDWHPDVVIASGQRMVWLAAAILPLYHQPFVAIGHGREFSARPTYSRALTDWAFGQADQVICVSHYTWQKMLEIGIKPRSGCVIPNGADDILFESISANESRETPTRGKDYEFMQPHPPTPAPLRGAGETSEARRGEVHEVTLSISHARESHDWRLLTVGNVTERKGQDIVIRALPTIVRQYPNVTYEMIGLPTLRDRLQRLASDLGVERHVHFSGYVDQATLARSLTMGDLFVMTSRHDSVGDFEGYGIAVVEAALCGKPAVVANNSGLAEAVIDGETGLIVPENDPEATADAILTLLRDDALRGRMGQAARTRALSEQTWRQRAVQYHEVLSRFVKVRN